MNSSGNYSFIIRSIAYSCIVLFWVVAITGMLYLPDLVSRWGSSQRVLHVLTFGGIVDPGYVRTFEEQTGIKVAWSYYSSNEELQAKLKKTGGKGYDLIVPSDYAVRVLREQNFLKPLDAARMPFLKTINPLLLNQSFDPGNSYSVPFEWELYGLGYDTNVIPQIAEPSWKLIFTDPLQYKIIMLDDPIEALQAAVQYTYGDQETIDSEQQLVIKQLLQNQKRWVEAYTSTRAGYYLATGSSPLALTSTSYIFNARKYAPHLAFAVPSEGGFITIENFAIPAAAEHDDLAYEFLAFIFTRESALHHFEEYANFPAVADSSFTELGDEFLPFVTMSSEQFRKLKFFNPVIPENQIRDFWVAVKS
jgi:spermidine/putrescine transport system substrate-binding protein